MLKQCTLVYAIHHGKLDWVLGNANRPSTSARTALNVSFHGVNNKENFPVVAMKYTIDESKVR